MLFKFLFLLVSILIVSTCNSTSSVDIDESVFLLPEGYVGPVMIIFDEKQGLSPIVRNNKTIYEIPSNGILRIRAKGKNIFGSQECYYSDGEGNRTKLEFLLPEGGEDFGKTFSEVDELDTSIYCMGTDIHNEEVNGRIVTFRMFLVGKSSNFDKLRIKKENMLIKAITESAIVN